MIQNINQKIKIYKKSFETVYESSISIKPNFNMGKTLELSPVILPICSFEYQSSFCVRSNQ